MEIVHYVIVQMHFMYFKRNLNTLNFSVDTQSYGIFSIQYIFL